MNLLILIESLSNFTIALAELLLTQMSFGVLDIMRPLFYSRGYISRTLAGWRASKRPYFKLISFAFIPQQDHRRSSGLRGGGLRHRHVPLQRRLRLRPGAEDQVAQGRRAHRLRDRAQVHPVIRSVADHHEDDRAGFRNVHLPRSVGSGLSQRQCDPHRSGSEPLIVEFNPGVFQSPLFEFWASPHSNIFYYVVCTIYSIYSWEREGGGCVAA